MVTDPYFGTPDDEVVVARIKTITIPDKFTNHDCILVQGYFVCDTQGMHEIDLRLIERDECFQELKKKGDSSLGKTIFWLGIGIVGGLFLNK